MLVIESSGSTIISENGDGGSYLVYLTSNPASDVTINLNVPDGILADKDSITFTRDIANKKGNFSLDFIYQQLPPEFLILIITLYI